MEWIKEIQAGWRGLAPSSRDLRNLGLLFAGVCALYAGWLAWHDSATWPWLAVLAVLWTAWSMAWPRGLRLVYLAWMGLALVLGTLVSRLLLSVVYYLVLSPLGLAIRLAGKDPLDIKGKSMDSYWRKRPASQYDPRQTEKMY